MTLNTVMNAMCLKFLFVSVSVYILTITTFVLKRFLKPLELNFNSLELILNTQSKCLLRGFNVPGFKLVNSFLQVNSHEI